MVSQQPGPEDQVGRTEERDRREGAGVRPDPAAQGEAGFWGGDAQRKPRSNAACFMVWSGNEAVCSFNLVRGTGRIFLIWVLIFEPFQNLE